MFLYGNCVLHTGYCLLGTGSGSPLGVVYRYIYWWIVHKLRVFHLTSAGAKLETSIATFRAAGGGRERAAELRGEIIDATEKPSLAAKSSLWAGGCPTEPLA